MRGIINLVFSRDFTTCYYGANISEMLAKMKHDALCKLVDDFVAKWFVDRSAVMYAIENNVNGEIPNASVIKDSLRYAEYKENWYALQREYLESKEGQQHVLREGHSPVMEAFIRADSAPLTKFKARSQMIAEMEEMVVKEVLPLQIGVNY